jgi:hypothetical protein
MLRAVLRYEPRERTGAGEVLQLLLAVLKGRCEGEAKRRGVCAKASTLLLYGGGHLVPEHF